MGMGLVRAKTLRNFDHPFVEPQMGKKTKMLFSSLRTDEILIKSSLRLNTNQNTHSRNLLVSY